MNYIPVISIIFVLYQSQNISALRKCPHKILANAGKISHTEIINLHNQYRMMAVNGSIRGQPRASPVSINLLKWDKKLEELALEVSKTCDFRHVDLNTTEFPHGLGQNLYRSCSNKRRKVNWNKIIGDWFDEHTLYKFSEEPSVSTGHYTQMMWGRSKLVGCSYTEYFQETKPKTPYCTLYVCHYAPRGNVEGERPYKPA